MTTDDRWKNVYLSVHNAAETMQDDWEERYIPSPSTIHSCRLKQWFQGKRYERTNRIPVESIKKMESGKAIEDFWRTVYTRAGFHVVSPTPPLTIGSMQSMGGDGILYVATEECSRALGLPLHTPLLLELKDFGAWSYIDFVLKGLQEAAPDYYEQVQSYMHGYNLEHCVFHAGMADSSGTKWIWRVVKKQTDSIPPFWMEIVPREPAVAMASMNRADEIRYAIDNIHNRIPLELRDHDPIALGNKFPCGYCGWQDACIEAGGVIPLRPR